MQRELPTGYYLRNFRVLIEEAADRYNDLLLDSELKFLDTFQDLPEIAARLYVRLIMRRGPLFRSDRIVYPDISDTRSAVTTLNDAGLLEVGGDFAAADALQMCTLTELRSMFDPPRGLRKKQTVERIVADQVPGVVRMKLLSVFTVLQPLKLEIVDLFRLLFFGNLGQDFSEFVVTELGHVRYEAYELDRHNRPFETRMDLDAAILVHTWNVAFEQYLETGDPGMLSALATEIQQATLPDSVSRRRDRIANTVARQLERNGKPDRAAALYKTSRLPPARERKVRLLAGEELHEEAAKLLGEIRANPLTDGELAFAESFEPRMHRRHSAPYTGGTPERPAAPTERIELVQTSMPVELAALDHLRSRGYEGAWCENALFRGLFGLGFWDIVFSPVSGAFHNRFQRGPSDLLSPDFRTNRLELIESRLPEVGGPGWPARVLSTYDKKLGVANFFVDWKRLSRTLVEAALERIPADHQRAVFDRLSRDVRENSAGFPDLFVYGTDYLLVEVKGPGDQLQKNQLRWMRSFAEVRIPYIVLRVSWTNI